MNRDRSFRFSVFSFPAAIPRLILVKEPFGHELIGETRDDAAGEAFDKVAKMLGLGFPGGPIIDRLAKEGDPNFLHVPRSFLKDFDFSFSGIKTYMLYWLRDQGLLRQDGNPPVLEPVLAANLCASFQAAVVDVLAAKVVKAVKHFGVRDVAVAGGVSANSSLHARLEEQARRGTLRLFIPKFDYCTDNGAMIAQLGWMKLRAGMASDLTLSPSANLSL